ncbi:MAG: ubiquinone/menaquinone biosynthesis methyltransferase [Bacteroidales bacterium]
MSTKENLAQAEIKAKGKPLQKMFNQVPNNYDFLNRLLTFRLDEYWRKMAVKAILKEEPEEVMDLGTGTGDLAIRVAKKLKNSGITGYDFSPAMLIHAKEKANKYDLGNVRFIEGDAAQMPFEDNKFDVTGISFAFRNITFKNPNTDLYLKEIYRTLKPGGKLIIVESSQPKSRVVRFLFHSYLHYIVSGVGGFISPARGAYHYLAYSAKKFYTRPELTQLIEKQGFKDTRHKPMLLGAAAITISTKPGEY